MGKRLIKEKKLIGGTTRKKTKQPKPKPRKKLARTAQDIKLHIGRVEIHSPTIRGVKVMGPVNEEFWVDVTSPKRGAWKYHKVSDVKKEMKGLIPKARYTGYFDGAKDNPNRIVYFKVPVDTELKGVYYDDWEMEVENNG